MLRRHGFRLERMRRSRREDRDHGKHSIPSLMANLLIVPVETLLSVGVSESIVGKLWNFLEQMELLICRRVVRFEQWLVRSTERI